MAIASGTRLGHYEILHLLGRGGMGEVYRARDTKLGRDVAVKVLSSAEARNASALVRFEQEARAASALNHPGILTIYDIGSAGEVPYLAMELVDGRSLDALLASGPLPLGRALSIAWQVAEALARAHRAGIVHRDLKPENVMVTPEGRAKIVDFGLAKLLGDPAEGAHRLTRTGFVVGTAAYMSPEQARGQTIDFRSDQFAVGSLLYEMLTGEPAFGGASLVKTMTAVIDGEPPRLASLGRQVPPAVAAILGRCLSKDPASRYPDTLQLAEALERARSEAERSASRLAAAATLPRWVRPSLLALAGVLLLAAGFAAGWCARARRPLEPPRLETPARRGAGTAPAASPVGSSPAFASGCDWPPAPFGSGWPRAPGR